MSSYTASVYGRKRPYTVTETYDRNTITCNTAKCGSKRRHFSRIRSYTIVYGVRNFRPGYCKTKQQVRARCSDNRRMDQCTVASDAVKLYSCKGNHLVTAKDCSHYREQEKEC